MTETIGQGRPTRRGLQTATVVSTGGDKTIHVVVTRLVKHPQYDKYMRRRTKLAVHDEKGSSRLGDVVEIAPCRRMSKAKAWKLVRVVRHSAIEAKVAEKEAVK